MDFLRCIVFPTRNIPMALKRTLVILIALQGNHIGNYAQ
jgi:hypothetical protein